MPKTKVNRNGAASWQHRLRHLYEAHTPLGYRFRYSLLAFDIVTILFIVGTTFIPRNDIVEMFDIVFGVAILADFAARMAISRKRLRDLLNVSTWADIAAIVSFLAPVVGEGLGFLRVMRTLRLLRTYH